jgi:3-hydroxyisobutyrate dehydrogenase-like beta-hydroxyacid dehydrogenase
MTSDTSLLAFLGTGAMGIPMAIRLVEAGFKVTVWNRTPERAKPLALLGAHVASDPEEAVSDADVVFLMLESGPVVDAVLWKSGVAEAIRSGSTVIDMSSIAPDMAKDHARRLAEQNIDHLDAPVSGGTSGAAAGDLAIMIGGEPEVVDRCLPLLRILGNPTYVGPHGAGQATKLINQIIVGVTIGAVAEGLSLGTRMGLDLDKVLVALQGGFADGRILREHGQRIVNAEFTAGGAIRIQSKDLSNALEVAEALGQDLPISARVKDQYVDLEVRGLGGLDHAALWLWYQSDTGAHDPGDLSGH